MGYLSNTGLARAWAIIKAKFVPITRTINGKALSADISLTAADVGAVPTTRTVNGKALSANVTLLPTDLGVRILSGRITVDNMGANEVSAVHFVWGSIGNPFTDTPRVIAIVRRTSSSQTLISYGVGEESKNGFTIAAVYSNATTSLSFNWIAVQHG